MNVLRGAFLGFLAGYILAICASQWVWLEMRINTGIVIPLAAIVSASVHLRRKFSLATLRPISLEIVILALMLLFYRFQFGALLVVPATLFKEGFFLSGMSLGTSNVILATVFLMGNLACLAIPERLRTDTVLRK